MSSTAPAATDPTTLAVIRGYLEEVVDEMDAVHVHSAFSPVITEMEDRANGIYDATGATVAQGRYGLPLFVGTMTEAVSAVLEAAERHAGGIRAGDVWMVNAPRLGGTHLNDVKLVKPFVWDGGPRMVLANTGHWIDVGSAQAAGFKPSVRSVHEEGIVFPPLRVVRDGELQGDVVELIRANTRLPDLVEGDLRGQVNALDLGHRRLERLFDRYGTETVLACVAELERRSERQMEARIEAIADGVYEVADALDNDGIVDAPVKIAMRIEVAGKRLTIDFEGTSPQVPGAVNVSRSAAVTSCYVGLKHLFAEVPINAGCFRPIEVIVPDGSVLDAAPGSAVGGYVEAAARIVGLVGRALADAIPEEATGTTFETGGVAIVDGRRADGSVYAAMLPYGGGHGGSAAGDGLVNATNPLGTATFPSLEFLERDFPLLWEEFAIREGSGGRGRWNGGGGNVYRFRMLLPAELSLLGDRAKSGPPGVLGGEAGAPNVVRYTLGGAWTRPPLLSKVQGAPLEEGDVVELMSPGGGGYGPPSERDPGLVARDERLGLSRTDPGTRPPGERARAAP